MMPQQLSMGDALDGDRRVVNDYLTSLLNRECAGGQGQVQRALRYAVLGTGQRIRPILSVRIARMMHGSIDTAMRPAASVELLHCASLIVDDLPCMDDSDVRRNRPSVHVQFGEAAALLAAFALVSLAARILVECDGDKDQRRRLADFQIQLLRSLDCSSLIAGQALDLKLDRIDYGKQLDVLELKTVPLFQLAVSAGALISNPSANEKALLRCFGREFGLAFQMIDDAIDGECIDQALLEEKFTTLHAAIEPFGPAGDELRQLLRYLETRVCDPVQV